VFAFLTTWGVVALHLGIPAVIAQLMTLLIFAGSQLVVVQLLAAGASGGVILAASSLLNLRHTLYSASLAPSLKALPVRWRCLLAYLLTDESFAVSSVHFQKRSGGPYRHWYLLGAGLTVWVAAQAGTALGLGLGARLPLGWSLDFISTLALIALVVPALKERASARAAGVAGTVTVLLAGLPLNLGLLAAAVAGVTGGLLVRPGKRSLMDVVAAYSWRWAGNVCYASLLYCFGRQVQHSGSSAADAALAAGSHALRIGLLPTLQSGQWSPGVQYPTSRRSAGGRTRRLAHRECAVDDQHWHADVVGVSTPDQLWLTMQGHSARIGRGRPPGAGVPDRATLGTPHEEAGARQLSLWEAAEAA
jgi:predicted branched-subunit amino acid permease